jgi:hypothetical protein
MRPIATAVLGLLAVSACGKKETATPLAASAPPAQSAQEVANDPHDAIQACKLITVEEMRAMLGAQIVPMPEEGAGSTRCVWSLPDGGMPQAELKIEWGMAEAALMAAGLMSQVEPGINNPYDELGDEAVVTGPVVMIKKGEDLFSIMAIGADDAEGIVRKMYETAVSRL